MTMPEATMNITVLYFGKKDSKVTFYHEVYIENHSQKEFDNDFRFCVLAPDH